MAKGASKLSGKSSSGGGSNSGSTMGRREQDFIDEMAIAMTKDVSADQEPGELLSNSDMQASVEAYALTHPGVDEDAMIDAIRKKADELSNSNKSVSGKPFNANDWKTWTLGTTVEYNAGRDIGAMDKQVRTSSKERKYNGVITQIGSDHIIVRADGSNLWVDDDNKNMFKVKKKGGR